MIVRKTERGGKRKRGGESQSVVAQQAVFCFFMTLLFLDISLVIRTSFWKEICIFCKLQVARVGLFCLAK